MFHSALLGNPVEHSISPQLFSLLAKELGIEYEHHKICVPRADDLPLFLKNLRENRYIGVNITLPYKISVMKYLDAIKPHACTIGAVNAVDFSQDQFVGFNTDAPAALTAIENKLKPIERKDKVIILAREVLHVQ